MSDKGKAAAIAQLRQEVGFGCPICRSPFLTWHHFDPPEHIEKHWRSEGIIALCPFCHGDADEKGESPGAYSKEELRALKVSPRSADDVKAHFPTWQDKRRLLIRIGGCYTEDGPPILSINGIPQITIGKNEAGLLSLSLTLRNQVDEVLVSIDDNWFTAYPKNIHDMIVTPKTKEVTVWLSEHDVGLKLSFKRVTPDQLAEILALDYQRGVAGSEGMIAKMLEGLPAEFRDSVEASVRKDQVGPGVVEWAVRNCAMDDGLIPLLDIDEMAIFFHGQRVVIKNGITEKISYCAAFNCRKGAVNLSCHCDKCAGMQGGWVYA
jgi:hypothetical protein